MVEESENVVPKNWMLVWGSLLGGATVHAVLFSALFKPWDAVTEWAPSHPVAFWGFALLAPVLLIGPVLMCPFLARWVSISVYFYVRWYVSGALVFSFILLSTAKVPRLVVLLPLVAGFMNHLLAIPNKREQARYLKFRQR